MTAVADRPQAVEPPPADRPAVDGAGWFAVAAMLLAGLAPLLLVVSTPHVGRSPWVWAWVLAVVVGLRYAWLVADGGRRLYELVFWLFTYAFLCLAPLVQVRTGQHPGTTPDVDDALDGRALAVVAVGAGAFAVGALLAGRAAPPARPTRQVALREDRLLVVTCLALLFTALYVALVGPGAFFGSREARNVAEGATFGNPTVLAVVSAAATLPLLVCFAGLVRLARERRAEGRRLTPVPAVLVLLALAVVVNPVSSPRYVAGTALLTVGTALGATGTRTRMRWFSLVLAAALVLVFPYADATRRTGADAATLASGGPATSLSSSDFDAFPQINNALAYVQQEGYTGTRQLVGAALFFVPRSVWSGKAEDTGILLADFRDYQVKNLSAPAWAELYLAGGWSVLVLGMLGLGALLRRLDRRALVRPVGGRGAGVLGGVLPFYAVIMLRGSLLQSMAGFTVLLLTGAVVTRKVPVSA